MPELPDFQLPDIRLPDRLKLPEPVIAEPKIEYPVVLIPSLTGRRATVRPQKVTPKAPKAGPPPGENQPTEEEARPDPVEEVVDQILDSVEPVLSAQSESLRLLEGRIETLRADVKLEIEEIEETFENKEITEITLPLMGWVIPMPKAEILVAAGTTAGVSVAATLTATAVFKKVVSAFKPVITQVVKRVRARLGKPGPTWSRQRLAQRHHRSSRKAN